VKHVSLLEEVRDVFFLHEKTLFIALDWLLYQWDIYLSLLDIYLEGLDVFYEHLDCSSRDIVILSDATNIPHDNSFVAAKHMDPREDFLSLHLTAAELFF